MNRRSLFAVLAGAPVAMAAATQANAAPVDRKLGCEKGDIEAAFTEAIEAELRDTNAELRRLITQMDAPTAAVRWESRDGWYLAIAEVSAINERTA